MEKNVRKSIKKMIYLLGIINILIIIIFQNILFKQNILLEINIYKIEICLLWIFLFIKIKKISNWNSILIIFFLTFSLFNFFRIFYDLLGIVNFEDGNFMKFYKLSQETQQKTLEVTLNCLIGFFLSFLFSSKKIENNFKESIFFKKISYIIIYSFGIFSFYSAYYLGKKVFMNGYKYLLSGIADDRNFLLRITDDIFPMGYYLFLASKPKKKEFYAITLLFIIYQILELLKGARSMPIANILLIFSVYFDIFNKKLKLNKALLISILLLSFSSIVGDIRSKEKLSYENIKTILVTQTISYTIIGQSIDEKNNLKNFDFYSSFYEPIEYWKNLLFNEIDMKRTSNLKTKVLADNLSYTLNKNLYLEGFGLGTNPIAEVNLTYGKYGVIVLFFIMGIFIKNIIVFSNKSILKKFFLLNIVPNIFTFGRNSYLFIDITKLTKIMLFISFLKIIAILYKRRKVSEKNNIC